MSKVSIIVPIYGVEKYIERCIRSLFEQTFDDIEYIFVNDCTKDASIEVLQTVIEEYPHRKSQIKILYHSENRGLPHARKTGILAASGDYVINFDSDDWVDVCAIDALYNKALQENSDVVICDFYISDESYCKIEKGAESNLDKAILIDKICQQKYSWAVWNKLVKRELFKNINYPIYTYAEDMALTLQLMVKADKIAYVPQPLYYYYSNPQSMTSILTEEKLLKNIEDKQANYEIALHELKKVLPSAKYLYFVELLKWQIKMSASRMLLIDQRYYGYWKSVYSDINLSMFFNPYINLKDKCLCILIHLRVYRQINQVLTWIKNKNLFSRKK